MTWFVGNLIRKIVFGCDRCVVLFEKKYDFGGSTGSWTPCSLWPNFCTTDNSHIFPYSCRSASNFICIGVKVVLALLLIGKCYRLLVSHVLLSKEARKFQGLASHEPWIFSLNQHFCEKSKQSLFPSSAYMVFFFIEDFS